MGNLLFKHAKRRKSFSGPVKESSKLDTPSFMSAPMPPIEELNTMFDLLLEDINLGPDKKEMMRQFPPERKWMICQVHIKERGGSDIENDYVQIIEALKSQPTTELLAGLVVSLRARPIRWISKFVENEGLVLLLNYLKSMEDSKIEIEHEELCIKCLKSLMNNKFGLSAVMSHPECLLVAALSLKSPSLRTRALVLEVLAGVCLIPGGHKRILECMTKFSKVTLERARFEMVINCLCADMMYNSGYIGNSKILSEEKYERVIDLQIASLSFINAVICGGPGKDLEFRAHMRWEFIKLGADVIIERISHTENEMLALQVQVYQEKEEEDNIELFKRNETKSINYESPLEMYNIIDNSIKNTRAYLYFADILRHFLAIPSLTLRKIQYYHLIAELVRQVLLQKDNQDSDPDASKIQINASTLITEMADSERIKEAEEKAKIQSEKAFNAEKELTTQRDTFMKEIEALEGKLKELTKKEQELSLDLSNHQKEVARLENLLKEKVVGSDSINAGSFLSKSSPTNTADTPADSAPPPPPPPPGAGAPPPPPPPGFSGAPPPPPPPGGPGGPPPPPPPGMPGVPNAMNGLPPKKNKLSTKQLKPLQWTKINNIEIPNTIWKQLDDTNIHKKMNYGEFEELFGAFQKKEKDDKEKLNGLGGSENIEAPKVQILDAKRTQMCHILLKSIKLSTDELRRAIFAVDTKILPPHIINELLKLVPTQDEILMLQPFEKDLNNLGSTEKFFWEISKIKFYGERVKALFTKGMFDEWFEDAKKNIKNWSTGTKELQNSKKFKELLQIVLALGNYLNSGQRGGAYGFKLDSLLKVGEVRSSVEIRRHTLLHYIVDLIEKKFSDAKGWQEEMKSIEPASKVEIPVLRQTLLSIRVGLKEINDLLENIAKEPRDPTDKFSSILGEWIKISQKKFDQLDQAFKDAEGSYSELCKTFGEDPKSLMPNDFFGIISQFIQAYNTAKGDNEQAIIKLIEMEKKEKERQDRNKTTKKGKGDNNENTSPQKDGELDDLISAIKTGKAFFNQDYSPQKRSKPKKSKPDSPDLNKLVRPEASKGEEKKLKKIRKPDLNLK